MRSSWLATGLVLLLAPPVLCPQTGNGRITGTVINSDGESISHAAICTTTRSSNGYSSSCNLAETDKDGRFELDHLPLGDIGVFADKPNAGYWTDDLGESQTVTLTSQEPLAQMVVKVGPRPGELSIDIRDKVSNKPVESSMVRTTQGSHTFIHEHSSTVNFFLRPDLDVMVQISAPGYKTWYYIDPNDPSQPVLRMRSGEHKAVDAYLELKPPEPSQ
jgi:hypothetical protein